MEPFERFRQVILTAGEYVGNSIPTTFNGTATIYSSFDPVVGHNLNDICSRLLAIMGRRSDGRITEIHEKDELFVYKITITRGVGFAFEIKHQDRLIAEYADYLVFYDSNGTPSMAFPDHLHKDRVIANFLRHYDDRLVDQPRYYVPGHDKFGQ